MYKVRERTVENKSPIAFNPTAFNVEKLIKKSVKPKRNKDGIIMISKNDLEGKEWYHHG